MSRHYDDAELLAYLEENEAIVDLETMRMHIASCPECAAHSDELSRWLSLLATDVVWNDRSDVTETVHDAIARDERENAAAVFIQRLPQNITSWQEQLAARKGLDERNVVCALVEQARRRYDGRPAEALRLIDLAIEHLAVISPADDRLEADVWKERANPLRLLGRAAEAFAALDRAEELYERFPASAYDCAFVYRSRATVFFSIKRFAEARCWLSKAKPILGSHSDDASLAEVGVLEGSILFDEGDLPAARDTFRALIPLLESLDDEESLARVYANVSGCEVRLGDVEAAREHATRAAEIYERRVMEAELVRLYWNLGDALRTMGRPHDALDALRTAADRFEALEMAGDVAAVGLDTAELLNECGEFSEAAALASRLVSYFQRSGNLIDAAQAFQYLLDAIKGWRATAELFAHVRQYVAARSSGARIRFTPPDEQLN